MRYRLGIIDQINYIEAVSKLIKISRYGSVLCLIRTRVLQKALRRLYMARDLGHFSKVNDIFIAFWLGFICQKLNKNQSAVDEFSRVLLSDEGNLETRSRRRICYKTTRIKRKSKRGFQSIIAPRERQSQQSLVCKMQGLYDER